MNRSKELLKVILIVLVLCGLGTITASIYYTNSRIDDLEDLINKSRKQVVIESTNGDSGTTTISVTPNQTKFECDETCLDSVNEIVDKLLEEKQVKTVIESKSSTKTSPTKTTSVSYVPISAVYSTTAMTWTDVPGSGVYVDTYNDYGSSAIVRFEVSLKTNQGNGRTYARLWDDTNKVSPNNSEIYSENNSDYVTLVSQPISMWRGNNLYKIQIKSLNGNEAFVNGAKIKIIH